MRDSSLRSRPRLSASASFFRRVYALVRSVPRGRVVTYGQIARALGAPRAARTVGWAMRDCPADVPWQRVVNRAAPSVSVRQPATTNSARA